MDENVMKLAAYVLVSGYRERVMNVLFEHKFMTPKYIAQHAKFRQNHVSKVLRELKEHGLIICINPEARKGKLYKLTLKGRDVIKVLPELKGENLNDL